MLLPLIYAMGGWQEADVGTGFEYALAGSVRSSHGTLTASERSSSITDLSASHTMTSRSAGISATVKEAQ